MAAVIKSNASKRQSQPTVFRFENFSAEGQENPEATAAAIIEAAQRQAEELCGHAVAEGQRTIEEDLQKRINERMDAVLPIVRQAVSQLADAKQTWMRRWEQSAVQLAVKIAERIVRREVAHSPQITLDLVREALELAAGAPQLKIRLHPADFAALEPQVKQLVQEISRSATTTIVPDETISAGGCRLETQHGVIDQQIETQLSRIAAELSGTDA